MKNRKRQGSWEGRNNEEKEEGRNVGRKKK